MCGGQLPSLPFIFTFHFHKNARYDHASVVTDTDTDIGSDVAYLLLHRLGHQHLDEFCSIGFCSSDGLIRFCARVAIYMWIPTCISTEKLSSRSFCQQRAHHTHPPEQTCHRHPINLSDRLSSLDQSIYCLCLTFAQATRAGHPT